MQYVFGTFWYVFTGTFIGTSENEPVTGETYCMELYSSPYTRSFLEPPILRAIESRIGLFLKYFFTTQETFCAMKIIFSEDLSNPSFVKGIVQKWRHANLDFYGLPLCHTKIAGFHASQYFITMVQMG